MKIVVGGVPFENFTSATIERNIEQFSGSFSFTATQVEGETSAVWALKAGLDCIITINDVPVITGFIDSVNPSTDPRSHELVIQGRDITADIVDSTLLASDVEMKPPVTLVDIIKKVTGSLGLDLKITDNANTEPFDTSDFVAAEEGQNAWDFIDTNAKKKQALVNTDGRGGIVCMRSDSAVDKGLRIFNTSTNPDSNVLSSSSNIDFSQRFGQYIVTSQGNLASQGALIQIEPSQLVTVRSGVVTDNEIRQSRRMIIVAEQASSVEDALKRAKWQANMNKARSITYNCSIDGFVHESGDYKGQPYSFNELVPIVDDNEGIDATMLVKSVKFTLDVDGGEVTEFEFVSKDSYKLELSDPSLQDKKANKVGSPFADLGAKVNTASNYNVPDYLKRPTA